MQIASALFDVLTPVFDKIEYHHHRRFDKERKKNRNDVVLFPFCRQKRSHAGDRHRDHVQEKLPDTRPVIDGQFLCLVADKDRGKKGKIVRVIPATARVVVEGVNMVKKHIRPKQGQKGQVVSVAMPVPVPTVMFICPQCGRPARLGIRRSPAGDGAQRICKKCQAAVE